MSDEDTVDTPASTPTERKSRRGRPPRTQMKVIEALEGGPKSAAAIAAELGRTAEGIRKAMYDLRAAGRVCKVDDLTWRLRGAHEEDVPVVARTMRRYAVTGTASVTLYAVVEATSLRKARALARDLAMPGRSAQPYFQDGGWQTDGELGDARVVDVTSAA